MISVMHCACASSHLPLQTLTACTAPLHVTAASDNTAMLCVISALLSSGRYMAALPVVRVLELARIRRRVWHHVWHTHIKFQHC